MKLDEIKSGTEVISMLTKRHHAAAGSKRFDQVDVSHVRHEQALGISWASSNLSFICTAARPRNDTYKAENVIESSSICLSLL